MIIRCFIKLAARCVTQRRRFLAQVLSEVAPSGQEASTESHTAVMTVSHERPPNPLEGASFLSQLTFSWPLPIIRLGVARAIEENDIPEILADEDSDRNRRRFEEVWKEEQEIAARKGQTPSLHRALLRLYFRTLWYIQPGIAITSIARIGQALALGRLIDHFGGDLQDHQHESEGYIWAVALITCATVPLVAHHQTYFRAWRMG